MGDIMVVLGVMAICFVGVNGVLMVGMMVVNWVWGGWGGVLGSDLLTVVRTRRMKIGTTSI